MLEHISEDDFESLLGWSALETLCDFGSHSGIGFACDDFFGLFQDFRCQVTGTGTDFEDNLRAC